MILIDKTELELFNLSYVIYRDSDVVQCVKHGLEVWEVAQLLGGN